MKLFSSLRSMTFAIFHRAQTEDELDELNAWLNGYTIEQSKAFYQRLAENLRSMPGVQSVGLAAVRIIDDSGWGSGLTVEGYSPSRPDDHAQACMNKISPNYFATLGVPFVAGRDFTP